MAMNPITFQAIEEAAVMRHGTKAVAERLVTPASTPQLVAIPDDRYLSTMCRRLFHAGLKHSLVDQKWPAFEEVFAGFDPTRVAALYDEDLEAMLEDKRLIRHMAKLRAVRHNAAAVRRVAETHGGFGAYIADWPATEITGLWGDLTQRMQQLGGNSAPNFLRMVGKDTFILSDSVTSGLAFWQAFSGSTKSKAALAEIQRVFNRWHEETGKPLCQLSQILAMSAD